MEGAKTIRKPQHGILASRFITIALNGSWPVSLVARMYSCCE